ncbi:MAG TPA: hypothetical protein VMU75_08810 [Acidimicrobiales bacterium]|nr:hypothetical protein [Acidimicrobiales bacterium]
MDRRRLPRQATDWSGWYRFEGDDEAEWRRCRIVDVSPAGASLELSDASRLGPLPGVDAGRAILVTADLRGQVRCTTPGREGQLRIGIEFDEARLGIEFDEPAGAARDRPGRDRRVATGSTGPS